MNQQQAESAAGPAAPAAELRPRIVVLGWDQRDDAAEEEQRGAGRRPQGLPVELGGLKFEVHADLDELEATARGAYELGGWKRLGHLRGAIWLSETFGVTRWPEYQGPFGVTRWPEYRGPPPRPQEPSGPIETLYVKAQTRLWKDIRGRLKEVEATAARLIGQRLEESREQVKQEARKYLAGYVEKEVFDNSARKAEFPSGITLVPGPLLDDLRENLKEAARLDREATAAMDRANEIWGPLSVDPSTGAGMSPPEEWRRERQVWAEMVERRARLVADVGRRSPVIHWLIDFEEADDEEKFAERIADELSRTWNSAYVVGERIKLRPMRGIGQRGHVTLLLGTAIEDDDNRGPWRYPTMIEEALQELGWASPSLAAAAAREALTRADPDLADALLEAGMLMSVFMALHVVAPPAAVAFDVIVSMWQLMVDLSKYSKRMEDYRAVLDAGQAVAKPPGVMGVAGSAAGLASALLPGKAGMAAVLPALLPQGGE